MTLGGPDPDRPTRDDGTRRATTSGRGTLAVVGTGLRIVGQLTVETIAAIRSADVLLHIAADPLAEGVLRAMNPRASSLFPCYAEGKPRAETYAEMVDRCLEPVRAGDRTCVAFYGHPGVFADAPHQMIARARAEGYVARMLPAVSAEDCLIADLGIDPGAQGCQAYEATDFAVHSRLVDPSSVLVLWQAGVFCNLDHRAGGYNLAALPVLVESLCRFYPADHPCVIYRTSTAPLGAPTVRTVPISGLPAAGLAAMDTLVVRPLRPPEPDPAVVARVEALMNAGAAAVTAG